MTSTVVLAGCEGLTGDDADDDNDDTQSPSGPLDPPSGTSEDGIDSIETLAQATHDALLANDYALRHEVPLRGADTVTIHIESSLDDERQLLVLDSAAETTAVFVADGTQYVRMQSNGETNYSTGSVRADSFEQRHETDQVGMIDGGEALGGLLDAGEYAPGETVTRNGRRLLRFGLESPNSSWSDGSNVEGATFVSADSVVFESGVTYDVDAGTVSWEYVIEELGDVTVEEPDWVTTAREQST
jgi:hypothetical protein